MTTNRTAWGQSSLICGALIFFTFQARAQVAYNPYTQQLTGTSGPVLNVSGKGYLIFPTGALAIVAGENSFATTNTNPLYIQYVPPASIVLTHIVIDLPSATNVTVLQGTVIGIMDNSCNLVANATAQILNAVSGKTTFTFASPPTLSQGVVYHVGFASENTTIFLFQVNDGGIMGILTNEGAGKNRIFTGATAATGTGATLALPASCGTQTASAFFPWIGALLP